jgi:capsular exopolysaccharide synthesis family protein
MSKIFDALSRDKGLIPDLSAETLLEDQIRTGVVDTPVASAVGETPTTKAPTEPVPDHSPPFSKSRVMQMRLHQKSPVLPFNEEEWLANEQYRMVRTKLLQHFRQPKLILVSSPGAADGKSTTAINLAGVLALKDQTKVLLVDGDFRKPSIAPSLGIPVSLGLSEMLEGKCSLAEAIVVPQEIPNLCILPAGQATANPAELLDSQAWKQTILELRRAFTYIVVDSPPIATVADYDLLQSVCDGVVIVMRPDHTKRAACQNALAAVPKDKLLGVIMNCVSEWFLGSAYGYGYNARYYHREK